jgi:hypothetical protein
VGDSQSGADTMTASYPLLIRDGIMDRIKLMPFFAAPPFKFTTNKALQIQPSTLPLCGVYFIQETSTPEGDSNAAEPRFRTNVRFGFSVIIINNDPESAEYVLDLAAQALAGGLFSDSTLYNNTAFKIQGYQLGARTHIFGNTALDNETPIAELRWELVCDLGVINYPPLVLDVLDLIHVKTAFPIDGTSQEQADVQQVTVEYDLPQN